MPPSAPMAASRSSYWIWWTTAAASPWVSTSSIDLGGRSGGGRQPQVAAFSWGISPIVLDICMVQPIQNVVIVGGGTAGWLTAGIIAARHPGRMKAGFTVKVGESPNISIISVGEDTWPTLRSSLEKMGISETEFFRHSDAAFKQGAKFARWTTGAVDDYYYHPLMLPQGFTQLNLVPHWLRDG